MKKVIRQSVFGVVSIGAVLTAVACGGGDGGTIAQPDSKGSSSGGSSSGSSGASSSGTSGSSSSSSSSSGGSSSGGSSSGGSSSGASSSGASSSGASSSGSSGAVDAGADSAPFHCGNPGDPGNSIGVGKYCDGLTDCLSNTKATLCATLGDPNAHFCTTTCAQGDNAACGENASCQCQGGQCGCFPDACK